MVKNVFIRSLVGCVLLLVVCTSKAFGQENIKRIKDNYRSMLISPANESDSLLADFIKIAPETEVSDQAVVELHQKYPFDLVKIKTYLKLQKEDGSWSDINYADTKRSGWEPKQHAERILELAKLYYSTSTEYHESKVIEKAIHDALSYWFTNKPKCLNWWYNQIGVPKTLGPAFILFENQLTDSEKSAAIEVMQNAKFGMTGQNKVWLAGNVLIMALLQNDEALVKEARDIIVSEIVLGQKEGIKSDWSFHQHGPQQQFGNYGLSFVSGMSFFCHLFKNTDYEFQETQMNILTSLIEKGYRWIIWHRYMDVSSLDRQLFHNAQIHKAYSTAFAAADLGIGGFSKSGNDLIGQKHFYDSDYTIHRSKDWMASVKMASTRVIGTELVNEDNLKGYYMADGATYYYIKGDEYLNVFPFWDWRKIPGITSYEDSWPIPLSKGIMTGNKSYKVGGLSKGNCGMTAMELKRDGLTAYKSWLFTDDYVFCLGAGIQSDSTLNVTTSIDQRIRNGKLSVLGKRGWTDIEGTETFHQKDLRFFHDRTGYIVLGEDTCKAQVERRIGRWGDFMKMYRLANIEGEVMALHISHGVSPKSGSYYYIVFPASDKDKIARFDVNSIKVIRNDSSAQVIKTAAAGNGYWVAAYNVLPLDIEGTLFTPEVPGIYYLEKEAQGVIIKQAEPFRER